ncbi:MAG: sulfatase [Paludibacter sp.]|nr:sulfatase [Paludibacter sp.]
MKSIIKNTTLLCASLFSQQLFAEHTNFVIIFLDDMGYGDIEENGAKGYETPNITKLAHEGMRFTDFYSAQAVSSASRAGLMTGCYPNRIGFKGALRPASPVGINPNEETIAELLKKKNYATAAVGKWHIGDAFPFLPLQNGFDEYLGLPYSNDMWPRHPSSKFPDLPLIEGNKAIKYLLKSEDQDQLTTIYTERSVDFINRNKKKPFFLYLAHSMPHVPLHVSDKFRGKSKQGLYGDVMMEIDWSVGEIMKALKKNGLDKNTLVIFSSDNGPWLNYGNHAGTTGGLREGKGTSYEGGQRVPCIMRWTNTIPAGTICNKLSSTIDILPTLAYISGSELSGNKIDGVNIYPLLTGDKEACPRNTFLYYYRENNLEAVRNSSFKLVLPHPGRSYEGFLPGNDGIPGKVDEQRQFEQALYDLRRDPGERYDVQTMYPEVMNELMKIAEDARMDLGDVLTNHPGTNRRPIGNTKQ